MAPAAPPAAAAVAALPTLATVPPAAFPVSYTHLDVYKRQVFSHVFCSLKTKK